MEKNNKIGLLVVGTLPRTAGYGGVTIHVSRLLDYLNYEEMVYNFVDYKSAPFFFLINSIISSKAVHLHITNPIAMFFLVLLGKLYGVKMIVTLHSNYGRYSYLKNILIKWSICVSEVPILINKKSFEICKMFNVKSRLIPAFIPPIKTSKLDDKTMELVTRLKKGGCMLCSTNAYNVSYDKMGNDIYGINFLIKEFSSYLDCVLLISDPSGNYRKLYMNNFNNIVFIDYPHNYYELLKLVDVFIRNTSTDGDAISVKEALFLKKKTLCTTVVDRPPGVLLYDYGNSESFKKAMNMDWNNKELEPVHSAIPELLSLYKDIMGS